LGGPNPSGPRSSRKAQDDLFNRIRSLGVVRPDDGRWVAGVASGLSRRLDVDQILIRGIFVALTVLGGVGVAVYGICWLLLPQEDGRIHLQEAVRGRFSAGFFGAVILSLAICGGGGRTWNGGGWFGWGIPGGLLLTFAVIIGIWWLARNHPGEFGSVPRASGVSGSGSGQYPTPQYLTPTPTPVGSGGGVGAGGAVGAQRPAYGTQAPQWSPPPDVAKAARRQARQRTASSKSLVRLTLGVALLAAALILVIGHQTNWSAPVGLIAAATALGVVAAGVMVSGLIGRRAAGLTGLGILLAIATLIGVATDNAGIRSGQTLTVIGSRTWQPHTAKVAGSQFNLGVGDATVRLTDPAILAGATATTPLHVSIRLGAGQMLLILPQNVSARVDAKLGTGELIRPDGSTQQIRGASHDASPVVTGPAAAPRIVVDAQQGVGQLEIRTSAPLSVTPAAPTNPPAPTATKAPLPSAAPKPAVTP
jgi:phage shock protein PspC (stress-responsive transcriptional regulator)